jgi:hypothetical protein
MLNMDFSQRLVIETATLDWQSSPMPGVMRKRMAFEDIERGHATSIVEFAPGSHFSPHGHPRGEEILVLEGIFSDEFGDYPAGCYFRNPEGFSHTPYSDTGCVLLVKLHQFQPDDRARLQVDTLNAEFISGAAGSTVLPLHGHGDENSELQRWSANSTMKLPAQADGREIFVVAGRFNDETETYAQGCWIREGSAGQMVAHAMEDTLLLVKTGHLATGFHSSQSNKQSHMPLE